MTKLPLFIVGKPGSSKSLSIKILSENLNGENSFNEFSSKQKKVEQEEFSNVALKSMKSNFKVIIENFIPSFGKDYFD